MLLRFFISFLIYTSVHMYNLKIFYISSVIFDFALGFFAPFWFLFLSDFGGGIEQFGYAIALMTIASAVTSLYAGKYSDKFGRKKMILFSTTGLAGIVLAYTLVHSVWSLYVLQILYGVAMSIQGTNEASLIGDLTEKDTRGTNIGKLHFYTQIAAAIAMITAGIIGAHFGLHVVFYTTTLLMLFSAVVVLKLKIDQ